MTDFDLECRRIMGLSRQAYLQGDYMYALNIIADDLEPFYELNKDKLSEGVLTDTTRRMIEAMQDNNYESMLSLAAELNEYYIQQGW